MSEFPRIAVDTGASSGIGRACASAFSDFGMAVVVGGRRLDSLEELVSSKSHGPMVTCVDDVTDPTSMDRLIQTAHTHFGDPTLFVLSAGVGMPGGLLNSDTDSWRDLLDVNTLAPMWQLRKSSEELIRQVRQGNADRARDLVVLGSTVGREVSAKNPVYGSTKFALHSLVEALRRELSKLSIRVSLIEPGFVRSGFQEAAGYDMEQVAELEEQIGPLLSPADVARTVRFVVTQPAHVHIDDIRLRPTRQER